MTEKNGIEKIRDELESIKMKCYIRCREDVKCIIQNQMTSENYIESTFQRLLDFYEDEIFMEWFWKLIAYVEPFNCDLAGCYRRLERTLREGN